MKIGDLVEFTLEAKRVLGKIIKVNVKTVVVEVKSRDKKGFDVIKRHIEKHNVVKA